MLPSQEQLQVSVQLVVSVYPGGQPQPCKVRTMANTMKTRARTPTDPQHSFLQSGCCLTVRVARAAKVGWRWKVGAEP